MKRITIILVTFVAGLILLAEVFSGVESSDEQLNDISQIKSDSSGVTFTQFSSDTLRIQPD